MTTNSIGTASRTYATVALWEADCPADLVASAATWEGEMYNDSEFTGTCTFSGVTSDATHNIQLRCATGQSFMDSAVTQPLGYNVSNGVGVRSSSADNTYHMSQSFMTIVGLQVKCESSNSYNRTAILSASGTDHSIRNCILLGDGAANNGHVVSFEGDGGSEIINCLIINTRTDSARSGVQLNRTGTSASKAIGCTVVKPTDAASGGTGINASVGTAAIVKGCAVFGYTTGFGGTFGGSSGYNATDFSSAPGSNNQVSKTYANQFENTTLASADYRAKTGGDLANNAIQFSETADLDIKVRARSVSTPTIGAWELAAASMAVTYDSGASKAQLNSGLSTIETSAFTIAGNFLVVAIFTGSSSSSNPTTVKWGGSGGTALTQVGSSIVLSAYVRMSVWKLAAPATGSGTVYASFSFAHEQQGLIAQSYSGVDQAIQIRNQTLTSGGSAASPQTSSVTTTSQSGDLVVDFVGFDTHTGANDIALTVGGSQTSRFEIEGASMSYEGVGGSDQPATGTSTTSTWSATATYSTSFDWAVAGLDLAAGGAAAFVINSVTPNVLYEGLTGVVIAGSGFGASQGTKTVYLDDKLQTVTAWADTSITITAVSPNLWANARLLQVRNT